jgi:predicted kinase
LPFDAIEFDEDLATIDVFYDLAFLLMDLERHHCRPAANLVLNRYVWRTARDLDLPGLALLPVFMAVRAGVRAMVRADRARQLDGTSRAEAVARAQESFQMALDYLEPPPARLVVVGGLSGTGKSTLAARLAPLFGAAPGALHLRSDLERKSLAGVEETTRLPAEAYTADATAKVYEVLANKARRALAAGHSVIVDAVFAGAGEREKLSAVAQTTDVPMTGLWLEAPPDALRSRVATRRGDASDATVDVVERQLGYDLGDVAWVRVDAGLDADRTFDAACQALTLAPHRS